MERDPRRERESVRVWDKGEVWSVADDLVIAYLNARKKLREQLHNVHSYFGVVGDCIAKHIPGAI